MAGQNPEKHQIVVRGVVSPFRTWDFSERAEALHWGVQTDGGDANASWVLDDIKPHEDVLPPVGSLVDISDEDGPLWSGLFTGFEGDPWTEGATLSYRAEGVGVRADFTKYLVETIYPTGLTFRNAFARARDDLCQPQVSGTNAHLHPVLGSINLTGPTPDLDGKSGQDVFRALASYVPSVLPPMRWHIRCDRENAGEPPYLEVFEYDATPKYFVRLSDGINLKTKADLHRVTNRVRVKWTDLYGGEDGKTPEVQQVIVSDLDSYASLGGIYIDKTVDATNDCFDPASATALGERLLADFSSIRPTGGSVTLDLGVEVRDENDQVVPLHRIYSGRVLEIVDFDWVDESYFGQHYPITSMTWNEDERQCVLGIGELNTLDRQVLHIVQKNQTALTRHAEGVTGKVDNTQKGKPGGVAPLNQDGRVPPEHAPTSLPNLDVKFDIEVLLAVDNTTPPSAVSKAGMTFSFNYEILGWRMISDAAGTITVDVRKGAFSAFPATDTGFSMAMSGADHNEFTFETHFVVAPGETLQFTPNLDIPPTLPTSTYVSIELLCARKL